MIDRKNYNLYSEEQMLSSDGRAPAMQAVGQGFESLTSVLIFSYNKKNNKNFLKGEKLMNMLNLAKGMLHIAINSGIGTIFGEIAKEFTPENAKAVTKFCISVSTIAAGALAGEICSNYVDKTIDTCVDLVKHSVKEAEGETQTEDVEAMGTSVEA